MSIKEIMMMQKHIIRFDFNMSSLYKITNEIGHKFKNLDRPLPMQIYNTVQIMYTNRHQDHEAISSLNQNFSLLINDCLS